MSIRKNVAGRKLKSSRSICNFVISGDNVSGIDLMLSSQWGGPEKVDIIEIDPPYNVGGNQGYRNIWKGQSDRFELLGKDHGLFLEFMEQRLLKSRNLLNDDGVIFIHICEQEFSQLKILMDMIYGSSNCIGTFIWNKYQGAAKAHLVESHEYIICYAKDKSLAPRFSREKQGAKLMIEKSKEFLKNHEFETAEKLMVEWSREKLKAGELTPGEAQYCHIHRDSGRLFQSDNSCAHDNPNGSRCVTPLRHPETGKLCPVPKNGWKWKEDTLFKLLKENRICFGKDHKSIPRLIRYLDEHMSETPQTVINMASNGKNDLAEDMNFLTPKPVNLLKYIISLYPKKDAVVLDFFAGSGTTAVATESLNRSDGGSRTWILMEEMESTINNVILPRLGKDSIENFSIIDIKSRKTKVA